MIITEPVLLEVLLVILHFHARKIILLLTLVLARLIDLFIMKKNLDVKNVLKKIHYLTILFKNVQFARIIQLGNLQLKNVFMNVKKVNTMKKNINRASMMKL